MTRCQSLGTQQGGLANVPSLDCFEQGGVCGGVQWPNVAIESDCTLSKGP